MEFQFQVWILFRSACFGKITAENILSQQPLLASSQTDPLIARSPEPVPSEPVPDSWLCRYPWKFVDGMEHSLIIESFAGVEIS